MDFYNFEDSCNLENLPLLNIEWTSILQFCFLGDLLKLCLFNKCLSTIDEEEEEQKSTLQLFLKDICYLSLKKNLEIHKHSWLSIIWITPYKPLLKKFPKLNPTNYLLNKTYKKSHSITWTLSALNKFMFHPNNCFALFQILSYWESTVAAPISSLSN